MHRALNARGPRVQLTMSVPCLHAWSAQVLGCRGGEQSVALYLPRIVFAVNHLAQPPPQLHTAARAIGDSAVAREVTAAQLQVCLHSCMLQRLVVLHFGRCEDIFDVPICHMHDVAFVI
jgi:hypothetical protein